jgi:molybdate transport system substrate-binding protein
MSASVKLLSGGAMKPLMSAVGPRFERASGYRLAPRFGPTLSQKKLIEAGEAFDLALLPREVIDDLVREGRIAAGAVDLARSAIGVTVRAGAARPDIATAGAFKRALQGARTISYSDGPSGVHVAGLLRRLGIAEEVQARIRLARGRPVADLVAKGEAEIGMQQVTEILPVAGAVLVGPLPDDLQHIIVYAGGIAAGARNADGGRAVMRFMASAEAAAAIRAMGMEPG